MKERYPMTQPYGWYHIAFSNELQPGDVFPRKFFGKDLVLYRTDGGHAKLLDAFCPHLGAHIGYGGRIDGETIICPFHSWHFDGDGVCIEVPYATKTPELVGKRCLKSWPVVEANRSIYAWFHPRNTSPLFDVILLPEFTDENEDWTDFVTRQWLVKCHIQESHENIIDVTHFKCVHLLEPSFDISYNGHQSRVVMESAADGLSSVSTVTTEYNGPGQTWARYSGFPRFIVLNPVTPIDDETVVFNIAVSFNRGMKGLEMIQEQVLAEMSKQVERDIPIFQNKIYRPHPPFTDADGPIVEFRQWYRQFYVDEVAVS